MRVDDVFSCIGGHSVGLQAAGLTTVRFCEADRWRRSVIERQFPGIPIDEDIRSAKPVEADLIVGGPPCQATSGAAAIHGYRTGASLWGDMLRVVRGGCYGWVVVEQPASAGTKWLAQVRDDLAGTGRHVRGAVFSARDLGAPHPRRRMYALAHASLSRLEIAWHAIPSAIEQVARSAFAGGVWSPGLARTVPVFNGDAPHPDRQRWIEAIGDSNPPQMMEVIGRAIVAAERQAA